jgi:hypothetical protein
MELTAAWGTPTGAVIILTTVVILGLTSASTLWPRREKVLPNPLKTGLISRLPDDELKNLVYQPDQFPGARDVETPVDCCPSPMDRL